MSLTTVKMDLEYSIIKLQVTLLPYSVFAKTGTEDEKKNIIIIILICFRDNAHVNRRESQYVQFQHNNDKTNVLFQCW
jgi:hypothetical protein